MAKRIESAQIHHGAEWPATVASLIVGSGFFALWFWLLPPWLGFRTDVAGVAP